MCWHYSYPDGYKGQWDIVPHLYLWSVCSFLLNLGREIALSMGNDKNFLLIGNNIK